MSLDMATRRHHLAVKEYAHTNGCPFSANEPKIYTQICTTLRKVRDVEERRERQRPEKENKCISIGHYACLEALLQGIREADSDCDHQESKPGC